MYVWICHKRIKNLKDYCIIRCLRELIISVDSAQYFFNVGLLRRSDPISLQTWRSEHSRKQMSEGNRSFRQPPNSIRRTTHTDANHVFRQFCWSYWWECLRGHWRYWNGAGRRSGRGQQSIPTVAVPVGSPHEKHHRCVKQNSGNV